MKRIFSPEGDRALISALRAKPLLALDFDGTLAPIVAEPSAARAPVETVQILMLLRNFMPIAIVTGRSVSDVSGRLGFSPDFIVGNHGSEGLPGQKEPVALPELASWREALEGRFRDELAAAGVSVEDKRHSLSLHYRQAPDRDLACAVIERVVRQLEPAPHRLGGKCVVNLLTKDAPDKFGAVSTLLKLSGCQTVIFSGDDLTDDVVFDKAPADWLTVRVEEISHSRARFCVAAQTEIVLFLRRLLTLADQLASA